MEVTEDSYDFGRVRQGEVSAVTHTFQFRNAGGRGLLIKRILPHCGCISTTASAPSIEPGGEGSLAVRLDLTGLYGFQSLTVDLETNDRNDPVHVFTLEGITIRPWLVDPPLLELANIVRGESREASGKVQSQCFEGETAHKITGFESPSPAVRAETEEFEIPSRPLKGRKHLEIDQPFRVCVHGEGELGIQEAPLLICTDDPKSPTLTATLRWIVDGDLGTTLKQVFLQRMYGKAQECPLSIYSRRGTPFEVLSIRAEPNEEERDTLEIVRGKADTPSRKNYILRVSEDVPKSEGFKRYAGKILVRTNHPETQVLEIPYYVSVRD